MHLFLDIDETLIHSSQQKVTANNCFVINLSAGDSGRYYVQTRPGLKKFLSFAFKNFKSVNIWTAATHDYAHAIIRRIMTDAQYKSLKFFNTRRNIVEGSKPLFTVFRTKRAQELGIRPENTIMIDDKLCVMQWNTGNGIVVPEWKGDENDTYLYKLMIVLKGILNYQIPTDSSSKHLVLSEITG